MKIPLVKEVVEDVDLQVTRVVIERLVKTEDFENLRLQMEVTISQNTKMTLKEAINVTDEFLVNQLAKMRQRQIATGVHYGLFDQWS